MFNFYYIVFIFPIDSSLVDNWVAKRIIIKSNTLLKHMKTFIQKVSLKGVGFK